MGHFQVFSSLYDIWEIELSVSLSLRLFVKLGPDLSSSLFSIVQRYPVWNGLTRRIDSRDYYQHPNTCTCVTSGTIRITVFFYSVVFQTGVYLTVVQAPMGAFCITFILH